MFEVCFSFVNFYEVLPNGANVLIPDNHYPPVFAGKQSVLQTSHPGVIITIAQEHGTAGKRVGQLGAEKLGIPCYYKEMTALAARESGLAKEFISGINSDENTVMRELYLSTSAARPRPSTRLPIRAPASSWAGRRN